MRAAWSRLRLEQLLALLTVAVISSKRVMPWHFSIAVQHGPSPSVPTHASRAQSCMRNEGFGVRFEHRHRAEHVASAMEHAGGLAYVGDLTDSG